MELWIYFVIGYALGVISPIVIMIVYARKQIKEALKPFRK
jgi:uncharacterized protein YybS (DUF2232 family)